VIARTSELPQAALLIGRAFGQPPTPTTDIGPFQALDDHRSTDVGSAWAPESA